MPGSGRQKKKYAKEREDGFPDEAHRSSGFETILLKVCIFSGQDLGSLSGGLITLYQVPPDLLSGHREGSCGWPVIRH